LAVRGLVADLGGRRFEPSCLAYLTSFGPRSPTRLTRAHTGLELTCEEPRRMIVSLDALDQLSG
jgi:hypothetical protein